MPDILGTLKTPRLAAAPSTPVVGQLYYNTASNELLWWNGTAWVSAKGLPADIVIAPSANLIQSRILVGDANPEFVLRGDGLLAWGPGGAVAPDTILQRSSPGNLFTPGAFQAGTLVVEGELYDSGGKWFIDTNGTHQWGPGDWSRDTSLYRDAYNILKMSGALRIATDLQIGKDSSGILYFGPSADVNMQRVAANQLRLTGILEVTDYLAVNALDPERIWLHPDGGIYWGNPADTVLKRMSPALLQTDGDFSLLGNLKGGGRVGEYCKYPVNQDCNNAIENGWWMVSNGLNTPNGAAGWWMLQVTCHNPIWTTQEAWDFTAGANSPRYERRQLNGVWSAWVNTNPPPAAGSPAPTSAPTFPGSPVNGQVHMLRLGSSPYTFKQFTFDSTLGKWISDEEWQMPMAWSTQRTLSDIGSTPTECNSGDRIAWQPFREFQALGLIPQFRHQGWEGQVAGGAMITHFTVGTVMETLGVNTAENALTSQAATQVDNASGSFLYRDSNWRSVTGLAAGDRCIMGMMGWRDSGGSLRDIGVKHIKIGLRWISP